ncbi:MAG TPA: carbohydrate kinase family protein [Acidobacteriota bacterium]|nr:carbohydrate kinase family protein [Acidobacteriota bacterium]
MTAVFDVVVAGHICLDLIPVIPEKAGAASQMLVPGTLTEVGPAVLSTGGAVSNTGLALHSLGIPTRLVAKVGDDLFGRAVIDLVGKRDASLAAGMIVSPGETTSYTVVISPPGTDRLFLHCPGANHTFQATDITVSQLQGARLFHFGYPPIMRRMWKDDGAELRQILEQAKLLGLTTSLDMVKPDPNSEAGRAPWRTLLTNVLPFVDVFLPSLEEILYMLDRSRFESLLVQAGSENVFSVVDTALLEEVASTLLGMGTAAVGLKLGDSGLYLQTTADPERWKRFGAACPSNLAEWMGRELFAPCFEVKVAGTTGSGDCTIAGFLAALLKGLNAPDAMIRAVGVGACNVEHADATSGIPRWEVVEKRISEGWPRLKPVVKTTAGWTWKQGLGIWVSPKDAKAKEATA